MILVYSCLAVASTTTSGYRVTPTPFGGCGVPAFPRGALCERRRRLEPERRSRVPGNAHGPTADHPSTAGGGALAFPGNARTTGPCGQIYGHSLGIGLTQAMPNAPPRHSPTRERGPRPIAGPTRIRPHSCTSAALACRVAPPHFSNVRPPRCPAAFQQHSPAGGEPAYRSAISAETNQAAWYGAKSMRGSRRSQEYPPRSSWASKPSRRARTSWRSATVSPVKL